MKMVIVKKVDTTYEVTEFLMNYVCILYIVLFYKCKPRKDDLNFVS